MEREIGKLTGHVIVCGYGRLGNNLASDLAHESEAIVIIENDPVIVQQAVDEGFLAIEGDATEEDILASAGVKNARTLVTTLPSDAANVFISLTTRDINNKIQII